MRSKLFFLMLALVMISAASVNAQVTIGSTENPPAYSLLELDATNVKGGLHLPRMTAEERNALTLNANAAGLMIFNTSSGCLEIWAGSAWKSLCESSLPGGANPSTPASFEENGRYALYGKILFDVNGGAMTTYPEPYRNYPSDYPRSCDFNSAEATTATYSLRSFPEGAFPFSSVQFAVDDPTGLLASYTTDNAAGTVTFTFKSLAEVKTLVDNADRTHAKKITITAFFLDNRGTKKKVDLAVRIQNAPVGCSVRKVSDPTVETPTIDGWLTFMCYNLGADPDYGDPIAQKTYVPVPNDRTSTDRTVYGDLYQWGRASDGHQRRDLAPENIWPHDHLGQATGFTEDPVPNAAANINTTTGQVLETDARFGKFIRRLTYNYDWIAGTKTNEGIYDNRWNIGTEETPIKAPADPCPAGWRVPTRTEWASIYGTTANCNDNAVCYTSAKVNKWQHDFATPSENSVTHGVSLTPSGAAENTAYGLSPTLFLPAGSARNHNHAAINTSGASSVYWSSSVVASSPLAHFQVFDSTRVLPSGTNARSNGNSVRCVSE